METSQTTEEKRLQIEDIIQNNKYSFTPEERRLKRFLEIIPGTISWTMILFPIVVSPFNAFVVGYYILIFDIYWFFKAVKLGIGSIIAYRRILKAQKEDWIKKMLDENLDFSKVIHIVMIPEAKEPIEVLRRNINRLVEQTMDSSKHLIIVQASEKIDLDADNKYNQLYEEYKGKVLDFIHTTHELKVGEIKGKHSNLRHASVEVVKYLDNKDYDQSLITLTSSDADSQLPREYYAQLTYKMLTDPDSKYRFYHGAMVYLANAFDIPFPNRVFAAGSSVNNISHLIYDDLLPVSTYTAKYETLKEVGFWDVDVIPEDMHMFFKTFFKFGDKVKTIPIYSIIYSDAAWGETFFKALKANYVQILRWAWGCSDDPYFIKKFFQANIPLGSKLKRIFRPLEEHFLWPVNWFIITLGTNIPFWLNDSFKNTAFSTGLIQVTQTIVTVSLVFIIAMIYIQIQLIPLTDKKLSNFRKIILALEWISLPVISFFFSMLPGLVAHTRLMFGKYLSYVVTEKK